MWGYYSVLVLLLLARPAIAFLHEMAHALAGLVLAPRNRIRVFLGNFGDTRRARRLRLGRLELWWDWRFLYRAAGLTDFSYPEGVETGRRWGIVLAGPLAVLLLCLGCAWLAMIPSDAGTQGNGMLRLTGALVCLLGLLDLFRALLQEQDPMPLADGSVTFGDGQVMVALWRFGKAAPVWFKALGDWEKDDYRAAAAGFEAVQSVAPKYKPIAEKLVYCYLCLSDWERALQEHEQMVGLHHPDALDLTNLGHLYIQRGDLEAAAAALDEAIRKAPGQHIALNSRGYLHILLADHESALKDLNLAIRREPEYPYSLNNRGYVRLMLGDIAGGHADILKALKLDPQNAYAHRNLGVYQLLYGDLEGAAEHFERAKLLDPTTEPLGVWMEKIAGQVQDKPSIPQQEI